ncbi:MAG: glycoside hydrolase family 92 protein [Bacteroidales bacterium]
MYRNATDGLRGNDDCGQMSAWYIFSSIGFYPVCPGSNEYVIGAPSVEKATINLENGKQFTVKATNLNEKNIYIQRIILNGNTLNGYILKHEEIMNGGTLEFVMGAKAKKYGCDGGCELRGFNARLRVLCQMFDVEVQRASGLLIPYNLILTTTHFHLKNTLQLTHTY